MLIQMNKMKEQKGFTLVELMIVVAIIGILAAVAVPYYQRYVAKSRLTALVMPTVRSVQTNISTFYAVQGTFPTFDADLTISNFLRDADTTFVEVDWLTSDCPNDANECLEFVVQVDAKDSNDKTPLRSIGTGDVNDVTFYGVPDRKDNALYWSYGGNLAVELGL